MRRTGESRCPGRPAAKTTWIPVRRDDGPYVAPANAGVQVRPIEKPRSRHTPGSRLDLAISEKQIFQSDSRLWGAHERFAD